MTKKNHTNKHERWNLTERLHRQTWRVENDRNKLFYTFGHIHTNRLIVLAVWFRFFVSVIFNRWCSSLSYFFGHVQKVNVCRCDLFGHAHIFWSYSICLVESVKWLFLHYMTFMALSTVAAFMSLTISFWVIIQLITRQTI